MKDCSHIWAYADELPISDVIDFWCGKSGFNSPACKAAKHAAILTACKGGLIAYGRSDGRTFEDPPGDLAGRGILTIHRDSFEKWVVENFESTSPLPEKPLLTSERDTLLKLIIGMAIKGYNHDPAASKSTAPREIADDLSELGMPITDDTVRKYLKLATGTVLPPKPSAPWIKTEFGNG